MTDMIRSLTAKQRTSLLGLTLLLVVLTVSAIVWVIKTNYHSVPGVTGIASSALIEKFEQNGLDYKYTADGQLLINQEQLGKSQLLLEQTKTGSYTSHGLELFDNTDYGMTEYTQKVTLQRALQGELERTLSSMSYIQYARVHLTLTDKKLFSRERIPAKASVTLFTNPDVEISSANITGVQSLVAAAVDGLPAKNVTVFSGDGKQISQSSSKEDTVGSKSNSKEAVLTEKIENLLGLYLEQKQFAVSVTIEVNRSKIDSVKRSVLVGAGGEGALLKKRITNTHTSDSEVAKNQSEEVEYTHGSQTEQITHLAGDIKVLSVAVAIVADLSDSDLAKFKALIASAAGINSARGDNLSVEYFKPVIIESTDKNLVESKVPAVVKEQATADVTEVESTSIPTVLYIVFGGLGVLILLTALFKTQRGRLSHKEREAVLIEMSDWLSEGVNKHAG
jgi:flagellar M-ring protein FliF